MPQTLDLKTASQAPKSSNVVVLFATANGEMGSDTAEIWAQTGLDFDAISKSSKFTGKPGQAFEVLAPAGVDAARLWVVAKPEFSDQSEALLEARGLGGKLMARLLGAQTEKASILFDGAGMSVEQGAAFAAGMKLRHYRFDRYKTSKKDDGEEAEKVTVTLVTSEKSKLDKALISALAVAEGTILARDLINEPPNQLGPVEFAEAARDLTELGMDVDILTPDEMEKLGMGSLLAVAQGSVRPARLAIMQWHGGKKGTAPLALVGKGVVFDTGGISIKPAGSMEDMKGDMGGAAAVIGAMKSIALRKAKANVIGVLGLVENMPDGNAYRPGDILKSMSGQTIEVINTDAEGRLVLADALWYTQDRFKPSAMIDLATLTGAIMVGLGQDYAGLFSNNDDLSEKLTSAGLASGDKVWRMPLGPAYAKLIESRFADMKNTGGRYGGAITAAQFLQKFANDVPWAHLDIAGTGFGAPGSDVNGGWAAGFGVALLDRLIADNYEGK